MTLNLLFSLLFILFIETNLFSEVNYATQNDSHNVGWLLLQTVHGNALLLYIFCSSKSVCVQRDIFSAGALLTNTVNRAFILCIITEQII